MHVCVSETDSHDLLGEEKQNRFNFARATSYRMQFHGTAPKVMLCACYRFSFFHVERAHCFWCRKMAWINVLNNCSIFFSINNCCFIFFTQVTFVENLVEKRILRTT